MRRKRFYINVFLDFEATCCNPRIARITQLGAAASVEGVELSKFNKYVNPVVQVSPKATEITGLTQELLQGEMKVEQVLALFFLWLDKMARTYPYFHGFRLVAHSGNSFDFPLLFMELRRSGLDPSAVLSRHNVVKTLDTYLWAKHGIPKTSLPVNAQGKPSLSLRNLYLHAVHPLYHVHGQPHDAMYDAYMLMAVCHAYRIDSRANSPRFLAPDVLIEKWKHCNKF